MITTEGQTSTGQEPRPVPTSKPRLLIVSDSSENLTRLRAALNVGDVEITSAASLEEVSRACRSPHDLAVIDLGPEQLVEALGRLR